MRRTVYIPETTEQLVTALKLDEPGWSNLLQRGLDLVIAELPPAKVERAVRRVARLQAAETAAEMRGRVVRATDADS